MRVRGPSLSQFHKKMSGKGGSYNLNCRLYRLFIHFLVINFKLDDILLTYFFKMPMSVHIEVAAGSFNPLFVKMIQFNDRHLSTSTFIFRKR